MPMTAGQFRECRDMIGWSQVRIAEELCVTQAKVRKWAHGSEKIPDIVAGWMRAFSVEIAAALHRNPPPAGKVPPKWIVDPPPRRAKPKPEKRPRPPKVEKSPRPPKAAKPPRLPVPRNRATVQRVKVALAQLRERHTREQNGAA